VTQVIKPSSTRVLDVAKIMKSSQNAEVARLLAKLHAANGIDSNLVVLDDYDGLTRINLDRYELTNAFATDLFNHWKLGDSAKQDGLLFAYFHRAACIHIKAGAGIDPIVKRHVTTTTTKMVEEFKAGHTGSGLVVGVDYLCNQLQTDYRLVKCSEVAKPTPLTPLTQLTPFNYFRSIWRGERKNISRNHLVVSGSLVAVALALGTYWAIQRYRKSRVLSEKTKPSVPSHVGTVTATNAKDKSPNTVPYQTPMQNQPSDEKKPLVAKNTPSTTVSDQSQVQHQPSVWRTILNGSQERAPISPVVETQTSVVRDILNTSQTHQPNSSLNVPITKPVPVSIIADYREWKKEQVATTSAPESSKPPTSTSIGNVTPAVPGVRHDSGWGSLTSTAPSKPSNTSKSTTSPASGWGAPPETTRSSNNSRSSSATSSDSGWGFSSSSPSPSPSSSSSGWGSLFGGGGGISGGGGGGGGGSTAASSGGGAAW